MKRVLFVDDDEAIVDLYSRVFTTEGYAVETCATMAEARNLLASQAFDAVVLDIRLTEGSGLSLLRDIKAANRSLPVILSTAYARYKDDFSSWLADDYVVKSSDLGELKAALRRHLGERL